MLKTIRFKPKTILKFNGPIEYDPLFSVEWAREQTENIGKLAKGGGLYKSDTGE